MPENVVEIELKVKTMKGKYTLIKDLYTRTERYHPWDRADKRVKIHTRMKRTPIMKIKIIPGIVQYSQIQEQIYPMAMDLGTPHQFLQIQI